MSDDNTILPELARDIWYGQTQETEMMTRRIMLATFAALSVAPLAHAEDAIVPNEFEQQHIVGACDHLGTGFAPLPGTGTCARVSGKVSVEKGFYNRSSRSGGQVQLDFETRSD